ncbi:MAG: hypothetical protein IJM81_00750 [Prevotella sp.]|nr:hypothetical protein [Prevotella sp.]
MKYAKIFMLFLAAGLFAACSDDDDAVNSQQTSVGFASEELVVKENSGYVNVPIQIEGYRNGNIYVEVEAAPTGENPAIEDEHYMITDKTLTLLNDTTETATMNVQIKTIDDQEINEARTFALNIKSLEGGQLTTKTINITLRDNDAAFYEKFFGKWRISFYDYDNDGNYAVIEKNITITGPTDEEDPEYDNILTVSAPSMYNVGVDLDFSWHFRYSFDAATKTGTLGFIMFETVSTYSTSYAWTFLSDDGEQYLTDDLVAEWALGANDAFPTTIEWESDAVLDFVLLANYGLWGIWDHIKIEKVQ